MIQREILKGTRLAFKAYAVLVPLVILLLAWIFLVFMRDGSTAEVAKVVDRGSKNKLEYLANEIYYYFWEGGRPKKMVEPKSINFIQRLWNYVMP